MMNPHPLARLMRLDARERLLYPLVALGLLSSHASSARFWLVAVAFGAFGFCCAALEQTLRTLRAYLDVEDPDAERSAHAHDHNPLWTGEVTPTQARAFAGALCAGAALSGAVVVACAEDPALLAPALALFGLLSSQHTFGLRLRSRGLGEVLLGLTVAAGVALPCLALHGHAEGHTLLLGLIAGLPYVAQALLENAEGSALDRRAGHQTLAVTLGVERMPWLADLVLSASLALCVLGLSLGVLPLAALAWVLLLPAQRSAVRLAYRGDFRGAQRAVQQSLRLGLAVMPASLFVGAQLSSAT